MLPVYREGDIVIVSPKAALRKGDRVVVKTTDGKVTVKIMQRKTAKRIELASFKAGKTQVVDMKNIEWRPGLSGLAKKHQFIEEARGRGETPPSS